MNHNSGPGFYRNIDILNYLDHPGVSQSTLRHLEKSPAHLKAAMSEERSSEALVIGSALHCLILEPHTFHEKFVVLPSGDGRTKAIKDAREEVLKTAAGRTPIKEDALDEVQKIGASVTSHPDVKLLMTNASDLEISAVWNQDNILCKGRADIAIDSVETLVDIKTTQSAGIGDFTREIAKYGYHAQAEWYLRGFRALGKDYKHFVFVAVEKEAPYAVNVFRLDAEAIAEGKKRNDKFFAIYAECVAKNEWPSYPTGIKDISIPDWAIDKGVEYAG